MKAAVYYQNGGPEVLKYEDVPDPECHPKGVVIRVEAVSIEGGDTLNRWHGALFSKPHVVGYQAGGEIVQVGAEVTDLKVGQKVTTVFGAGSHAALRAVPARNAWPVPKGFDIKLAAAIPVPFGTADDCLFEFGHLKSGETVLSAGGRERCRCRGDSIGQACRCDSAGDGVEQRAAGTAEAARSRSRHQL